MFQASDECNYAAIWLTTRRPTDKREQRNELGGIEMEDIPSDADISTMFPKRVDDWSINVVAIQEPRMMQ